MKYYPINVDVKGHTVLVVGGGEMARQKIIGLLESGAKVRVLAPRICGEIEQMGKEGRVRIDLKEYEKGDLKGARLAFGATGRSEIHRRIHEEALQEGVLFNAVDDPAQCDFTVPSRLSRGDLLLTASTGGRAPFLSKALRVRLEQLFGPEYEDWTFLWGQLRDRLSALGKKNELLPFFEQEGDRILSHLKKNETEMADQILKDRFGAGFSLRELGLKPSLR